jgi:inosine-uridine nucleoside N-ribohydrolase
MAFVVCMLTVCASAAQKPIPIVLDTDIGGDIDDAFALALVLSSPELDLRAVTTVSGDTKARARIAAKMLWVAGNRGVPVAAGMPGSKMDISQAAWADGFSSASLVNDSAVDLMKKGIERGRGETVLVAIGPLTNIAELFRKYPDVKSRIKRIVLMGGSIARGYYPNSRATAEYNIAADTAASQAVFASGVPIMMAPLDVTARLQIQGNNLQKVFAHSKRFGDALHALYGLWGQPSPTLHDPMAVSLLINPQLCTTKELAIEIDAHGMTRAVEGRPAHAVVAVETDPARFIDFYVNRVAK